MSGLYIPGEDNNENATNEGGNVLEVNYEPTQKDEECFFLIYNMGIQPSEAYGLEQEHRRWLVGRSMMQKQMERDMMEQSRIARQVLPNLGNLRA